MRCPTCGADIAPGNQFCRQCGTPVAGPGWVPPLPAAGAVRAGAPRTSPARVVAGIAAFAAAALIVVACALPYVKYTLSGRTTSISIFNAGPGASASNLWFAVEPVAVAALAIVGGILLLAVRQGVLRWVVAGTLVAFGTQTLLLFLGYTLGLDYGTNRMGIGGAIGILGGLLLGAAGIVAAASGDRRSPAAAPGLSGPYPPSGPNPPARPYVTPGQNPPAGPYAPPGSSPPPGPYSPPGSGPPPGPYSPPGSNPPPGPYSPPGSNPPAPR